jgi:menaquinone-dependent protoporphyrinogen oxidase
MTTVLIAYASKHHATKGIAFVIGKYLEDNGLKVDILAADKVDDIGHYDAVVLGSAIYAGRWQSEAVDFIKNRVDELLRLPVWVFSSGPTGEGDPVELVKGVLYPAALEDYMTQIQPRDITVFHGKLDKEELALWERLIVTGVKAPVGDYRNWGQIQEWAGKIVNVLVTEPVVE